MALSTYRKKRDFARTPEPAGGERSGVTTRGFVVQRHRARRLDQAASLAAGELHFDLYGVKLRGRFVLIRTRGDDWLLLHKNDDHAVEGWNAEDHPFSVLSGRTNDDVKAGRFPEVGVDSLVALDALGKGGTWEVFGRSLRVTNLEKVLFPGRDGEAPVTKREFLRYTAQIAPTLVPYLSRRALNLHRYPDGADKPGFWHKELPDHAPDWLPRWDNPEADPGETRIYLVVDEPAALVWAANFGGLEWHPWTSRVSAPQEPSYALIDLDPGVSTRWADVLELARLHRTAFEHLGVTARAKVTGRRGIQIWVPIDAGPGFDETRAWVAPYSPRPAAGAPISAPIEWDELEDPSLRPDGFTIRTILPRLAERGDLFRDVLDHPQQLPPLN
jgi:bifunctional non-homologous end joining protein LigD